MEQARERTCGSIQTARCRALRTPSSREQSGVRFGTKTITNQTESIHQLTDTNSPFRIIVVVISLAVFETVLGKSLENPREYTRHAVETKNRNCWEKRLVPLCWLPVLSVHFAEEV
jgi:hypothetical protein